MNFQILILSNIFRQFSWRKAEIRRRLWIHSCQWASSRECDLPYKLVFGVVDEIFRNFMLRNESRMVEIMRRLWIHNICTWAIGQECDLPKLLSGVQCSGSRIRKSARVVKVSSRNFVWWKEISPKFCFTVKFRTIRNTAKTLRCYAKRNFVNFSH
jgi:hypothetical protein